MSFFIYKELVQLRHDGRPVTRLEPLRALGYRPYTTRIYFDLKNIGIPPEILQTDVETYIGLEYLGRFSVFQSSVL